MAAARRRIDYVAGKPASASPAPRSPRRPGKNDSSASSESVTSTGVPNTMVVVKKLATSPASLTRNGTTICGAGGGAGRGRPGCAARGVARTSSSSSIRPASAVSRSGGAAVDDVRPPLGVASAIRGAEPLRMQAEAQRVHRAGEQRRVDAVVELRQRAVGGDDVPVPVDREGRIGPVAARRMSTRLGARRARARPGCARETPARSRPRPAARCARASAPPAARRGAGSCRGSAAPGRSRRSSGGARRPRPRRPGRAGSCAAAGATRAGDRRPRPRSPA